MSEKAIAFDIDGTLTIPAIQTLANSLYDSGRFVIVITGGLYKPDENPEMRRRVNRRREQLRKLGVKYHKLHVCLGVTTEEVAIKKAAICRDFDISVIFEDSDQYINVIRATTDTLVLDVRNE